MTGIGTGSTALVVVVPRVPASVGLSPSIITIVIIKLINGLLAL